MNATTQPADDAGDMTDEQLVDEHNSLFRVQETLVDAGETDAAREAAAERYELWQEADDRGLNGGLIG